MNTQSALRQPLLGAHMSIAGGLEKALLRGHALGCTTIQLFTKTSNQWKERVLEESEIQLFREVRTKAGIEPVISHASYLINLASPDGELYTKSLDAMVHEIRRCEQLGIDYLVVHPGFHKGCGEEWGIDRITGALDAIHADTAGAKVRITLETTAGQGTALGGSLEQIARIIERVKENSRLAFCLDTCHTFVAGYDLRTRQNYLDLFRKMNDTIGRKNLKVIHLNDSKREKGSRVDRHENIGDGMIGEDLFRLIMRDESLVDVPKIIETPGDIENLQLLKSFA
ncbi:MAG: deoxyribonuclease IV [Deltaproteobacteria bacterium]|nr:deoxyribonuclease IV [Deltaproteobacteria bacterium]